MVSESKIEEIKTRTANLLENLSHELLEDWLDFLPKAHNNLPVTAEFLHQTKVHSVKADLEPDVLFPALELLRPLSIKCIKVLTENYIEAGHEEKPDTEPQIRTALDLLRAMNVGYTTIVKAGNKLENLDILGNALHRAISSQFLLMVIYSQLHMAIPGKEWRKLHQLFTISVENKLPGFGCIDAELFADQELKIMQVYIITLLLGCSLLNHLTPKQIDTVSQYLIRWASEPSLSKKPEGNKSLQILIDVKGGAGPVLTEISGMDISGCYFLQLGKLVQHLESLLPKEESEKQKSDEETGEDENKGIPSDAPKPDEAPATEELDLEKSKSPQTYVKGSSFDKTLVAYLLSAWSELAHGEERVSTDESILACIGPRSIHYYMCGGKDLKGFLGEMVSLSIVYEDDEDVASIEQKRSGDVWSSFLTEPEGDLINEELPSEINFQHDFEELVSAEPSPEFPNHKIKMVDESDHGCCL
jgi:hypothetical protein